MPTIAKLALTRTALLYLWMTYKWYGIIFDIEGVTIPIVVLFF
ncbi:MAG TPA: hypothetical protein VMU83_13995 [Hanamia sp.]|nr:hypothetical protein [Hanamia sp.]